MSEWLPEPPAPAEAEWLVDGFIACERHLGESFIERTRLAHMPGECRSLPTTIEVATIGRMVGRIHNAPGARTLLKKLRNLDQSAVAELLGIDLILSLVPHAEVEIEPVGPDGKRPDARFRWPGQDWVYLEVTERLETGTMDRIWALLEMMQDRCRTLVPCGVNAHLHVRRSPDPVEMAAIIDGCRTAVQDRAADRELFNGVAHITLDWSGSNRIETRDPNRPQESGAVIAWAENNSQHGALVVSTSHSDPKIEQIVGKEAGQTWTTHPSVILVHRSSGTRTAATWINRLRTHFAEKRCGHPSGAWLFSHDFSRFPTAEKVSFVHGVANAFAEAPLPPTLIDGLRDLADPASLAWAAKYPDEL